MPDLSSWLAYALISLGMVLTPGPNMIYLISRSICQGRTAGFISLGGVALGFLVYMLCAALGITALVMAMPFAEDLIALHRDKGLDGILAMPDDWWLEIGPVGTLDDAAAHLALLEEAGAHSIGLFPAPEVAIGRAQVDDVLALARR